MKRRKQGANLRLRFSKRISITKNKCPSCKCSPVFKIAAKRRHAPHRKRAYNLAFTHSAVKRQVLVFHTKVHQCTSCGHEFVPEEYVRLDRHFHGLKSFIMYLHVEHRLSLEDAARIVEELFGIRLSIQDAHMFKSLMARFYRHTYRLILRRLLSGKLLHVDETEVHLQHEKGYIWVFTNLHEVLYMFRPSREGEFLKDLLLPFSGVLVSDFYSAYDSLSCPQQKCLIHLIQDMNRSLLEAPYDQDLQLLTEPFGKLLRSIVSTIDRHGLKRRHLRHHEHDVAAYFRFLASTSLNSETAISLQSRLLHYREKLFTFIKHDGIPWNNNNAENAIKKFAYYRERTEKRLKQRGLCDYLTMLSISETCRYRGVSFLRFMLSGQKDISAFCEGKRQSREHKTKAEMYPRGFLPLSIARLRRQFSKGGETDSRLANDYAASR